MGYKTDYKGTIYIESKLNDEQKEKLSSFFGEDCHDHPEWWPELEGLSWIDLEWEYGKEGVSFSWDGSEKTYDLLEKINGITKLMRKEWPEFKLSGMLEGQGEDWGDLFAIVIDDDGIAHEKRGEIIYNI